MSHTNTKKDLNLPRNSLEERLDVDENNNSRRKLYSEARYQSKGFQNKKTVGMNPIIKNSVLDSNQTLSSIEPKKGKMLKAASSFTISEHLKVKWHKVLRKLLLLHKIIRVLQNIKNRVRNESNYVCIEDQENIFRLAGPNQHRPAIIGNKKCVISPDSKGAWIWMLIIVLLLIWTAVYVPYRLSFLDQVSLGIIIMETAIDLIFMIDIFLNFITAYYNDQNVLITDHCLIAKKYLKTWFIIDLISCFPVQLLETKQKYSKAVRLLRLPRLYKMLKFLRFMKMFNFMNSATVYKKFFFLVKLNSGFGRLLKVLVAMIFFTHLYACLWYFVAKFKDFPPDCWVMQMGVIDYQNFDKYLISFYWVLQTLTTVGYGEMPMGNKTEIIFALFLMIFGVGLYSYTIGNLSSLFANMDAREAKLNSKILALNEYAYNIKMPPTLYLKIISILRQNSATAYNTYFDQEALLEELPPALKNEVLSCTHRKILNSFAFFKNKPPQFVMDILPLFRPFSLLKDEAIFRKGDVAEEVHFLLEGRVGFVTQEGYLYRNYIEGAYFGEVEMFKDKKFRTSSAITMTNIDVLMIKKQDLQRVLEDYPSIKKDMLTVAIQREKGNTEAMQIAKTAGFKVDEQKLKCIKGMVEHNLYEDIFSHEEILESSSERSSSYTSTDNEANSNNPLTEIMEEDIELEERTHLKDHMKTNSPTNTSMEEAKVYTASEGVNILTKENLHDFRGIIHSTPHFSSSSNVEKALPDCSDINIIEEKKEAMKEPVIESPRVTPKEGTKERKRRSKVLKLENKIKGFTDLANNIKSPKLSTQKGNTGRLSISRRNALLHPLIGLDSPSPYIYKYDINGGESVGNKERINNNVGNKGEYEFLIIQLNKLVALSVESARQLKGVGDNIEQLERKITAGRQRKEKGNIRW